LLLRRASLSSLPLFWKDLGTSPLLFYEEAAESPVSTPEVHRNYPLVLSTGGRFVCHYHFESKQRESGTREVYSHSLADIHTEDALENGIKDGGKMRIETRRGRIK
jgi:anaerobic selenocysteine-containing dehydrogenase